MILKWLIFSAVLCNYCSELIVAVVFVDIIIGQWYVREQKKMWGQVGTQQNNAPTFIGKKLSNFCSASFSSWKSSFFFPQTKISELQRKIQHLYQLWVLEVCLSEHLETSIPDTCRHFLWLISSLKQLIRNYWRESIRNKNVNVFSNVMILLILCNIRTD